MSVNVVALLREAGKLSPKATDGVWPAASKPAGLHDHKSEPSTTHSCFPHLIRRASPDTFPASRRRGREGSKWKKIDELSSRENSDER